MSFPTGLLLLKALYHCCDSAALFCSHWRGDHSKPTETLLEPSANKSGQEAAISNLTFHVFACVLFCFQTLPQTEQYSCGQHLHFEPAPILPPGPGY